MQSTPIAFLWAFACAARVCVGLRADEMTKGKGPLGVPDVLQLPLKTLVILNHLRDKDQFSSFFDGLQQVGHKLTFAERKAPIVLEEQSEHIYDNVMLIDSNAQRPKGRLRAEDLLRVVDSPAGGNVVVVTGLQPSGPSASGSIDGFHVDPLARSFALQCGVDYDPDNSAVFNHFGSNARDSGGLLIESNNMIGEGVVANMPGSGVAYKGLGMLLDPKNSFTFPIFRGTSTSYSARCNGTQLTAVSPLSTGEDVILVSAMQARNGARVSFFGSVEMFRNDMIERFPGNLDFSLGVAMWTFKQRGFLKWTNLIHHKFGEISPPHLYQIKDEIEFHIDLWQLHTTYVKGNNTPLNISNLVQEWHPYVADDVQLEYTMIDPFLRIFLDPPTTNKSATYTSRFTTPDKQGVFKFVLFYKRFGYNVIHMESLAPLRNLRHDGVERFIWCASPYYGSVFVVMVASYVFCFFFIYHKDHYTYDHPSVHSSEAPAGNLTQLSTTDSLPPSSPGKNDTRNVRKRKK